MKRHIRPLVAATLALAVAVAVAVSVYSQPEQQALQHGFEGGEPIWLAGPFDAAYKETKHLLTDETAHTGQKSELIWTETQSRSK